MAPQKKRNFFQKRDKAILFCPRSYPEKDEEKHWRKIFRQRKSIVSFSKETIAETLKVPVLTNQMEGGSNSCDEGVDGYR